MNSYNYFILVTEHHLIQFERAISHFNLNNDFIVVFVFKFSINNDSYKWIDVLKSNKKLIVFDYIQWSPIEMVTSRKELRRFLSDLKSLSKNNNLRLFTNSYYIDASRLAEKILKPKEYYIMDEGNASFGLILKRPKEKRLSLYHFLISLFYGKLITLPKSIIYFTQYNLPISNSNDKIEKYSFDKIDNKITFDENSMIILGSSMYSVKNPLISEVEYLSILKKVVFLYGKNKNKLYYAHRTEPASFLNFIEKIGFVVKKNYAPFEFVFSKMVICPMYIISFASPVLDTLSKKFMNIPKFVVIKPYYNNFLHNNDVYELIYKSYELNDKLEILTIDDK
ncbi:MAG: hypothetical protein PF487_03405 [Bacteroidales bacterium]|jgi:hypothetical protein|nr:hypothetical protein [Bacteroidales bacterium]